MLTHRLAGLSAILLAILFNLPFAILASIFDYPDILRQPVGTVLDRFAAGGPTLVLVWLSFTLAALAFLPVGIALASLSAPDKPLPLARSLAIGTATAAALAQAIGLSRWVFAIPALAAIHADPGSTPAAREMTEIAFSILHNWGGVAIGEHLGQWLTLMFLVAMAAIQWQASERLSRLLSVLAVAGAGFIGLGLADSVLIALGQPETPFALLTVIGYLLFSLWLVLTGLAMLLTRSTDGRKTEAAPTRLASVAHPA